MNYVTKFGELFLHDQRGDAVDTRYSVQTETGGILFLFNESGLTAREVFETFVLGADLTLKTAARGETAEDEIERLQRRVVALERMISEEMDAWETSDEINQMLIETAHDAHKRRTLSTSNQTSKGD